MAITSGMFMSVNGDRKYQASWFAKYFASFIGNGVFPNPSTGLQVLDNANMTTKVKTGDAWINGYYMSNDGDFVLQHDVADGLLNRIDRVVVRWDLATRAIDIRIKKGVGATAAKAPTLQRNGDAYELALADVSIPKGLTTITSAQITDHRLNTELCGIVTGVVKQVDTTAIFDQYQSWFAQQKLDYENNLTDWTADKRDEYDAFQIKRTEEFDVFQSAREESFNTWQTQEKADFDIWFEALQGLVKGDVVLNLQSQITTITKSLNAHKAVQAHTTAVHGMRVTDGVFEFFNGTEWTAVKGGGGVEPPTITEKKIAFKDKSASLTWADPTQLLVNNTDGVRVQLSDWNGVKIVRNDKRSPRDETDGVVVYESNIADSHRFEPLVDTGLTNGTRYFYKAFPISKKGTVGLSDVNNFQSGVPKDMDDFTASPGPKLLIAGNTSAGFFGEVPSSELFTGTQLLVQANTAGGSILKDNPAWLKFMLDGKILFVAKEVMRYNFGNRYLVAKKAIKGAPDGLTVSKNGVQYYLRLLTGTGSNGVNEKSLYEDNAGVSEYSRLMLPILERAKTQDYNKSDVPYTVPIWKHTLGTGNTMYKDSDLFSASNGKTTGCQEKAGAEWSARVVESFARSSDWEIVPTHGWRPVLEVIQ